MECFIRKAKENEYRAIIHLLASNNLPTSDIYQKNISLFVGLQDNEIIATIGIEIYEKVALLRSLCVKEGFKNQHFGKKMLTHLLTVCAKEKIEMLYLLTTTAERYFLRHGFEKIARENTPFIIQQTHEFKDICPSSAVVMRLTL